LLKLLSDVFLVYPPVIRREEEIGYGFEYGEDYTLLLSLCRRLFIPRSFNIFSVFSYCCCFFFSSSIFLISFFLVYFLDLFDMKEVSKDSHICPKDLFKLPSFLELVFDSSFYYSSSF